MFSPRSIFFFFVIDQCCQRNERMSPKRTKQSSITSMGFSLLQKPRDMCVDRQIKVLGSYWKGHMSNEDVNSLYLYTVRNYHALHKWDSGGTPSQVMEIQEMGVDGQGSRETGGSASDHIFFMKYPIPSLQHWYGTFPPTQQTCPPARLLSSSTGLLYPMTSSLMAEILDNTQPHSSETLR